MAARWVIERAKPKGRNDKTETAPELDAKKRIRDLAQYHDNLTEDQQS
jgi:hypothetical protein